MSPLPGIYVEDLRESSIRVRDQQSVDSRDRWFVLGFKGKKCVSLQGFRLKANAEDWAGRLRKWKYQAKILPKSKIKFKD